ncbi:hypothetical protein IZU99_00935 [Oscillospiraceae bacterium CM]|nr:hypothetical protein IZU99_00935 [Oscillospiraceae bacterium CM]
MVRYNYRVNDLAQASEQGARTYHKIIYLDDHRRGKKQKKTDTFWNVAFILLCAAVVVCLFWL